MFVVIVHRVWRVGGAGAGQRGDDDQVDVHHLGHVLCSVRQFAGADGNDCVRVERLRLFGEFACVAFARRTVVAQNGCEELVFSRIVEERVGGFDAGDDDGVVIVLDVLADLFGHSRCADVTVGTGRTSES